MTTQTAPAKWIGWVGGIAVAAILFGALLPFFPAMLARLGNVAWDGPNWSLWARLPAIIQLHVLSAVAAMAIGSVIFVRPKGRALHKTLGWGWVFAMGMTAVSSLFITGLNGDVYSLVHILSGWTIVALPMAVFAIRNRKVVAHRRAMTGIFVGGLVIAGSLSFLPGRFMFEFFFG